MFMRHDYRILHDMLINGKIDTNEFKERIDAIKLNRMLKNTGNQSDRMSTYNFTK